MKIAAAFALAAIAAAVSAATGALAASGLDAVLGKALFERDWIPAPASTRSSDGLGPLFNARSCAGCHVGETLGARFIDVDGMIAGRGLVLRFADAEGRPDPLYGSLLQTQGVPGVRPEGRIVLTAAADGAMQANVELQRGPLAEGTRASFRAAPPLVGTAAFETVDATAVLALADPDDRDGDGVSGRPRLLSDGTLGRYGWKAGNATLDAQIAAAFAIDMGLSSALHDLPYGDCTLLQPDCLGAPTGEVAAERRSGADAPLGHELTDEMVPLIATFVRSLPKVSSNATPPAAFASVGCASCHVPTMPTTDGGAVAIFSDLLLHDLGPGLDDGVGEPGAAAAEWRTAPLMSLGGEGRRYLHDGRAATIDEAIRVHGGEATAAVTAYRSLTDAERNALLAYLEAL